jgi:hypothetical protein
VNVHRLDDDHVVKFGVALIATKSANAGVDDFRGALERNVMRYYLAIDSYLQSLSAPPAEQREARLRAFYAYTKRYSPQLHEDDEFLPKKQAQLARQPVLS